MLNCQMLLLHPFSFFQFNVTCKCTYVSCFLYEHAVLPACLVFLVIPCKLSSVVNLFFSLLFLIRTLLQIVSSLDSVRQYGWELQLVWDMHDEGFSPTRCRRAGGPINPSRGCRGMEKDVTGSETVGWKILLSTVLHTMAGVMNTQLFIN